MKRDKSVDFTGYWQRHLPANARITGLQLNDDAYSTADW
jgi:hypothetical protein